MYEPLPNEPEGRQQPLQGETHGSPPQCGEGAQGAGAEAEIRTPKTALNEYAQIMPPWMQTAFRNNPLVQECVMRSANALYDKQQMLLAVCEVLFTACISFREMLSQREMMNGALNDKLSDSAGNGATKAEL